MENSELKEKLNNIENSEGFRLSGFGKYGYSIEREQCLELPEGMILSLSRTIETEGKDVRVNIKTLVDKENFNALIDAKSATKDIDRSLHPWLSYDSLVHKHYFVYVELSGLFDSDKYTIMTIDSPTADYRGDQIIRIKVHDPYKNNDGDYTKKYESNYVSDYISDYASDEKYLGYILSSYKEDLTREKVLNLKHLLNPTGYGLDDGKDFIKLIYRIIKEDIYPDFVRDSKAPFVEYSINKLADKYDLNDEEKDQLFKDYGNFVDKRNINRKEDNPGKDFTEDLHIPYYSFLGSAGVGKNSLAKDLAKLYGYDLYIISAGQLKGSYVGHTMSKIYRLLAENDGMESGEKQLPEGPLIMKETLLKGDKPSIIFIDEAYELANDRFGREAVSYLLPIMSHDMNQLTYRRNIGNGEVVLNHNLKKWPVIWMAGYEQDMHDMLFSKNTGLERRMTHLLINTPGMDRLLEVMRCKVKDYLYFRNVEGDTESIVSEIIDKNEKVLRRFLLWATSRENERFFANYAGIALLADNLVDIYKRKGADSNYLDEAISLIKSEITRKYKLELNVSIDNNGNKIKKQHFKVIHGGSKTFDDIKGNHNAVGSLNNIVKMISRESDYYNKGIHIPRGALLEGPPGTGKTLLARAMAGSLQKALNDNKDSPDKRCPLIQLTASELSDYTDPERIERLMNDASQYDACIIFIDEIDAIGRKRENNENYQTLLKLMTAIDGFENNGKVFFLAATNDAEALDPALTRPGRFDRVIRVELPDMESRKEILGYYFDKLDLDRDGDVRVPNVTDDLLKDLSKRTAGCSGAQIENFVNEAAILYTEVRSKLNDRSDLSDLRFLLTKKDPGNEEIGDEIDKMDLNTLFTKCFLETIERDLVGEIRDREEDEEDNMRRDENKGLYSIAVHETGHALMSMELLKKKPFDKITLVARGNALGYVKPDPENNGNDSKNDIEKRIMICMGGRAAEEEIFGEEKISTGASQDIQQATRYAEAMVFDYGMSRDMGFMALRERRTSDLGDSYIYKCSDEMRNKGEQIVRDILSDLYEKTRRLIKDKRELLQSLSETVLDRIEMTGSEFRDEYEGLLESK